MRKQVVWPLIGSVVAVIAFTATPVDARAWTVKRARVRGEPVLDQTDTTGLYFWKDNKGFHVRWKTNGTPRLFEGRIDTDKPIQKISRISKVGSGWVRQTGKRVIMFSSTSRGEIDGFDFGLSSIGRKLQLELTIDGKKPKRKQVNFGARQFHPGGLPVMIKYR